MEEDEARGGGGGAAAEGGRGSPEDTESQIKAAMQSRVSHFKEEAECVGFSSTPLLFCFLRF